METVRVDCCYECSAVIEGEPVVLYSLEDAEWFCSTECMRTSMSAEGGESPSRPQQAHVPQCRCIECDVHPADCSCWECCEAADWRFMAELRATASAGPAPRGDDDLPF